MKINGGIKGLDHSSKSLALVLNLGFSFWFLSKHIKSFMCFSRTYLLSTCYDNTHLTNKCLKNTKKDKRKSKIHSFPD